jgi:hypothetical protein
MFADAEKEYKEKGDESGLHNLPSNQCFTSSRRSIKQEALDVLNTKFFDQARGDLVFSTSRASCFMDLRELVKH